MQAFQIERYSAYNKSSLSGQSHDFQPKSAPPLKGRHAQGRPDGKEKTADLKSTKFTISNECLSNSFYGKRSLGDIWDDLFQVDSYSMFQESAAHPPVKPRVELAEEIRLRSEQGTDISMKAQVGSIQPIKGRLIGGKGNLQIGRRVASVNIQGVISKFEGKVGVRESNLGSRVQQQVDSETSPVKDSQVVNKEQSFVSHQSEEQKALNASAKPRELDNRRYCIVDNFLFNSARPLSDKLNASIERFKATLFDCERDMNELLEPVKAKAFAHISFACSRKFDKKSYLQLLQSAIEFLISHFRGVDVVKSLSKKSVLSYHTLANPLKSDPVFMAVRKLFNFETILVIFELYFKILILASNNERAEHLAKLSLSLAFISGINKFKIEAFTMLGQVYEAQKQPEKALVCYCRAMQLCIEVGDKAQEFYMCDKVGVQLYYMNEMSLAKEYHERMLTSFEEPAMSNAILRSKEILQVCESQIANYFLLRQGNILDKYRAADMLLSLQIMPCEDIIAVERGYDGGPVVLNFITMMLTTQRRELESIKMTKMSFIKDSLFGKKNRDSERKKLLRNSEHQVSFTRAGEKLLIECSEYIPAISANLLSMNVKENLRITHLKNSNNLLNYLNQSQEKPQDYDHVRLKCIETLKKNKTEDILMFLTRSRYYVMRKLNEVTNVKASKYHRMLRPSVIKRSSNALILNK